VKCHFRAKVIFQPCADREDALNKKKVISRWARGEYHIPCVLAVSIHSYSLTNVESCAGIVDYPLQSVVYRFKLRQNCRLPTPKCCVSLQAPPHCFSFRRSIMRLQRLYTTRHTGVCVSARINDDGGRYCGVPCVTKMLRWIGGGRGVMPQRNICKQQVVG